MNTIILDQNLTAFMAEHKFEKITVNGDTVFRSGEKYVRIVCGEKHAAVEVACGLQDAEHNIYEDIDLYDYEHMKSNGFPKEGDIFTEICADIEKYIISQ